MDYGRKKVRFATRELAERFVELYEDLFIMPKKSTDPKQNLYEIYDESEFRKHYILNDKNYDFLVTFLMKHEDWYKIEKDLGIQSKEFKVIGYLSCYMMEHSKVFIKEQL